MAFYRTYRPQIIDDIDNASVRDLLLSLLRKDKKALPHAYLFSGPRGTGKTTAARVIAKLFNCTKLSKTNGPCGTCDQCKTIAQGRNLDVLEIDAASNRGIDEIRALRDGIALTPVSGTHKIYIIDEVHMLTTEAFNALLKTLEEPPVHAVFVLATTDPQKVPATITSRCVMVSFGRAQGAELLHALERIVKEEHIDIETNALAVIVGAADGSFRDAVKFLEQVSFHKGGITAPVVQELLMISNEQTVETFLQLLGKRKTKEALTHIQELISDGRDIKTFLVSCLHALEKMLIGMVNGKTPDVWTLPDMKEAIQRLSQAYGEMRSVAIAQLPLELAVVEFCENTAIRDTKEAIREEKISIAQTQEVVEKKDEAQVQSPGLLTLEKLTDCWRDFIEELKPYNHSVAGVMRSARPKTVGHGIVTIEAFYKFHQEKLNEIKTREILSQVLKKLFGESVTVEIVLGTK